MRVYNCYCLVYLSLPPGVGAVESEDGSKKKAEQDDEGGFLEELLNIFSEHRKVRHRSCHYVSSECLLSGVVCFVFVIFLSFLSNPMFRS